jgi:hypothetical protein
VFGCLWLCMHGLHSPKWCRSLAASRNEFHKQFLGKISEKQNEQFKHQLPTARPGCTESNQPTTLHQTAISQSEDVACFTSHCHTSTHTSSLNTVRVFNTHQVCATLLKRDQRASLTTSTAVLNRCQFGVASSESARLSGVLEARLLGHTAFARIPVRLLRATGAPWSQRAHRCNLNLPHQEKPENIKPSRRRLPKSNVSPQVLQHATTWPGLSVGV